MATVLLAYEFGAGLGHLNRLSAVAARLRGSHRLVFALPDMSLAAGLRRDFGDDAEIREGVHWPPPTDANARKIPTHTFADVIRLFGFDDVERLVGNAERWLTLLAEVKPDLIVADFAPTLRLASGGRIPTIIVGNGYTVPPGSQPLPRLRPWETVIPPLSRAHEGRLLGGVNEARARLKGAAVDHFADLFQGEETFVCTIAEFDPYGDRRQAPVLWPFNIPAVESGGPLSERQGPAAFAYFQRNHPALGQVMASLSALGRRSEIYVQGADPVEMAKGAGRSVGIHRRPADFGKVLPSSGVLIHHAGLGTASAGLMAGIPQIVLPVNLEHTLTARGLALFGVATHLPLPPQLDAPKLTSAFARALEDGQMQAAALDAAAELHRRRDPDPVGRVVQAAGALL
ncbi:UDP:flavonoid glycosyltransferase YjiC, YdhE family [Faunimonas pinastri]|uniref:UDP:flavonoid glycosyltransferase YjiC, YdhE family n=1 Tax=Faunimonas pinastri TaxID=1855383 RepID=A0A1H9D6G6_9HYPH|nr:nucleotide disphospho-sugar-binding domain-containing protein [Faunimonas pinastri]SEQ08453.1 UDP:flavonoid glycosyltransferase YjiC, YdhE family [Faunimonas pinastri]